MNAEAEDALRRKCENEQNQDLNQRNDLDRPHVG